MTFGFSGFEQIFEGERLRDLFEGGDGLCPDVERPLRRISPGIDEHLETLCGRLHIFQQWPCLGMVAIARGPLSLAWRGASSL